MMSRNAPSGCTRWKRDGVGRIVGGDTADMRGFMRRVGVRPYNGGIEADSRRADVKEPFDGVLEVGRFDRPADRRREHDARLEMEGVGATAVGDGGHGGCHVGHDLGSRWAGRLLECQQAVVGGLEDLPSFDGVAEPRIEVVGVVGDAALERAAVDRRAAGDGRACAAGAAAAGGCQHRQDGRDRDCDLLHEDPSYEVRLRGSSHR